MATHSSILVWAIPWAEESAGPQLMGHKESDMIEVTNTHTHTHTRLVGFCVRIKNVEGITLLWNCHFSDEEIKIHTQVGIRVCELLILLQSLAYH